MLQVLLGVEPLLAIRRARKEFIFPLDREATSSIYKMNVGGD